LISTSAISITTGHTRAGANIPPTHDPVTVMSPRCPDPTPPSPRWADQGVPARSLTRSEEHLV
jgi:hypothetical protein